MNRYIRFASFIVASITLITFGVLYHVNVSADTAEAQTVSDIDKQIREKQKEIEELQEETEDFKQAIRERQAEAQTLETAIGDLDLAIEVRSNDIEKKQSELDLVELEIVDLEKQIEQKRAEINTSKGRLSTTIADYYILEQTTPLEIVMSSDNFSDFFSNIEYTNTLQEGTQDALDSLQTLKATLDEQNGNLHTKQDSLEEKKLELVTARAGLEHEQADKEHLLVATAEDETKFQQMIDERQKTQSAINAEIGRLEKRRKSADGTEPDVLQGEAGDWMWPVSGRTITTYFEDPNYVFNRYFVHRAIDVDGVQGDPIYAVNDGVVTAAHFSGLSFAFVIVQHAGGFSTLYGHPNAIYVSVGDEVAQGEVIAAVGGIPGTPGAGSLTTGDHIHFAMYLNGVPVDPLIYLP